MTIEGAGRRPAPESIMVAAPGERRWEGGAAPRGGRAALGSFWRHRSLVRSLIRRDIKQRYLGSGLPAFWAVASPLVLIATFTFVFSTILRVRFRPGEGTLAYALELLVGLLPWMAFQEGLARGSLSLVENGNLVRRVPFPSETIPSSSVLGAMVQAVVGLAFLLVFFWLRQGRVPAAGLALAPLLVLQGLFALGLTWGVASVVVVLRDAAPLVAPILTVWMYLTPVVYPEALVPAGWKIVILANPMTHFVRAYRTVLVDGAFPGATAWAVTAAATGAALVAGHRVFRALSPRFADAL